ncbi:LysE family translocator [Sphingomonas sp.]|uniref:LysE family translocator n=1 Tax=Sphingomonas sp. TaxID=28214 RepID=UPI00286CAD74|nr:LysE family translocator [Sphingomonas sp.]
MTTLYALAALTLFALASSITPGPNNLMLLSSGTRFGFRQTLPHMVGVTLGFGLMIGLIGLGLARLFTLFPALQLVLKVVSVVYLLILAWKIATSAPPTADEEGRGRPLTFLQAAAFQWVNPKGWTLGITAMSAYLPPVGPWLGPLLVAVVAMTVTAPSVALWTAIGMHLRRFLDQPAKLRAFNWTAAALLVVSLVPVVRGH